MKRSFFDRLSGNVVSGDQLDSFDDELLPEAPRAERAEAPAVRPASTPVAERVQNPSEGQLPVDVYQTGSDIIRAFVAGVRPDELSISIARDMVEIEGSRMEREQVAGPDYFTRELFWGSFSRTILLPQEVDVESASASAKDGLLTLILPKLDKAKQTKLKVKAG
jgi:HSP20 family protein